MEKYIQQWINQEVQIIEHIKIQIIYQIRDRTTEEKELQKCKSRDKQRIQRKINRLKYINRDIISNYTKRIIISMNSIKKLQNTIIKSPIGKPIDNNHKQWSSVIVRIRFRTGISGIERPYEYLISKRLNPTGIYKNKGYWNCPGGLREKGETFTQCAEREFQQECGWKNHPKIKYYGKLHFIDNENEERLIKVYIMNIWSEDLIHIQNAEPDKHSPWIHKLLTEIMLLPIIDSLKYYIKQELQIQTIPKLIIIEGVDGCGKTTLANEIIQEIGEENITFNRRTIFNKYDAFKFTRKDANHHGYNEAQFRQAVVQSINRRIEFVNGKKPFIILDKTQYSEILYKKTESIKKYKTIYFTKEW